jgi:hypothetical protein
MDDKCFTKEIRIYNKKCQLSIFHKINKIFIKIYLNAFINLLCLEINFSFGFYKESRGLKAARD